MHCLAFSWYTYSHHRKTVNPLTDIPVFKLFLYAVHSVAPSKIDIMLILRICGEVDM